MGFGPCKLARQIFRNWTWLPILASLLRGAPLEHLDIFLLRPHHCLIGYSNYCIAGYVEHFSDCADPYDNAIKNGIRPALEVQLSKDDYKEMALVEYIP